jgi:hypothetical protein
MEAWPPDETLVLLTASSLTLVLLTTPPARGELGSCDGTQIFPQ